MFLLLCYIYVLTLQTLEIHLEIRSIDRSINALMLLISSVCATGFLISALVGNLLWFSWAPLRLPYYVNLISRRIVHVLISVPCP